MPLKRGRQNIGSNIRELEASPTKRPMKQIIAIALNTANPKTKPTTLGKVKRGR